LANSRGFLVDEVNLNQTRIDTLSSRVGTIETFLIKSAWKPKIRGFRDPGHTAPSLSRIPAACSAPT
jgi:hypothetical protein